MPEADSINPSGRNTSPAEQRSTTDDHEIESLLSATSSEDLVVTTDNSFLLAAPIVPVSPAPRTPNRVRFALDDPQSGEVERAAWMDEEDYLNSDEDDDDYDGDESAERGGRAPLLTEVEAPSVTLASEFDTDEMLQERPKSGMKMAFMNMANSIIGAGIIGQPYAFRQAGLGMGIFLLISLTLIVDWTINLIVINSKLSGSNSFQETVKHCFGQPGLIAISIAQWAFAFGGMIAFCIIIGDTIPHVVTALFPSIHSTPVLSLLANRRAVIIIFTLGISYPLSLYRDIAKLAKASAFALASMLIIILTVVTQGFRVPEESRGKFTKSLLTVNDGVFQAIGVISFAFVCHHNSLLIYGSLRKPTLDRFAQVTHFSTGISMFACLGMAMAGFLSFRDKTAGNVLNNFPNDNIMVNIARFCFGLNMLTTLPLEAFVCRSVIETFFFPNSPHNPTRHLLSTTALVLTAMSLSLMTCDLGIVFELIGATSACALAYILPPLCYIKLSTRSWRTYGAAATVVFGVMVMFISLFQSLWGILEGGGSKGAVTC